jgi:hypothetical protein
MAQRLRRPGHVLPRVRGSRLGALPCATPPSGPATELDREESVCRAVLGRLPVTVMPTPRRVRTHPAPSQHRQRPARQLSRA